MRFLIIGLGIYGSNLATDLTSLGHEVIGADISASLVENIKDFISTAYILDATDETALSVLPLSNVDLVVVAIGENFGASIKTVALLKKLQVKKIFARAIDPLHESILQGIGVARILTPEQRAAFDLVNEMALGPSVDTLRIDADNYVMKFYAPTYMLGMAYATLNLAERYGLRLIAVARPQKARNVIGMEHTEHRVVDLAANPDASVAAGDIWTCYGPLKKFHALT